MNQLDTAAKAAIRCTRCNRYRKHTEFKAPISTADNLDPICDRCRRYNPGTGGESLKQIAKALDIPVLAFTAAKPSGEVTTVSKALGLDKMAKEAALDAALAKCDATYDNLGRMFAWYRRQWALEDCAKEIAQHVRGMVKAELAQRRSAEVAKAERLKTEAKFRKAAAKQERTTLLAQFAGTQDELKKQSEALAARVAIVTANAERGLRAQELQRCRVTAAAEAREERERENWLAKAGGTTDPILRAAYLARADGRDLDEDDY
jgi:hypothetical protein